MTDEISITHTEDGAKGRYEARVEGHDGQGELTYSRASPALIIADHTAVDDSLRGMGVGQALVERLVADARGGNYKIMPLCPFVKSQYQRHPDWSDVMET